MIIPDVNLPLYAHVDGLPRHVQARRWWERVLSRGEEIGLGGPALFGFLRIATNPRILDPPLAVDDAVGRAEEWLTRRHVQFLLPGPRHMEIAFRLLRQLGTAANLTSDVQLAALAIEYQAELHSNDTDFGRFSELRWVDPLRETS